MNKNEQIDELANNNIQRLTKKGFWEITGRLAFDPKQRAKRIRLLWKCQREFADLLKETAQQISKKDIKLLEIGCGNSIWLPYFAKLNTTFHVVGIDYSQKGCALAEMNLMAMESKADIVCEDFFSYASHQSETFDLIMSFGFIEHFSHPQEILARMHEMLARDGIVIATIPNFCGIYGKLQGMIHKATLEAHKRMNPQDLYNHALSAGFHFVETGYAGGISGLSLLTFDHKPNFPHILARGLAKVFFAWDTFLKGALGIIHLNKNNAFTSPYIFVRARK